MNEFTYTGLATDVGGVESHHHESPQWLIGVWNISFPPEIALQGSLENMRGEHFQFTVHESLYVTYAKVLESEYNGLGKRYDEEDRHIPKYVILKLKELAKEKVIK